MNNLNDIFFAPVANQDLTYDQVLEDVQRYFAENHASTIAEAGEGNAERATTLLKELMVQYIVKRKYAIEGLTTEELCEKLYGHFGKWRSPAQAHFGAPGIGTAAAEPAHGKMGGLHLAPGKAWAG